MLFAIRTTFFLYHFMFFLSIYFSMKISEKVFRKYVTNIIICVLIVACAFIYVSGYRITKNIWWKMILIDIYRMVIGFAGSVFWISFWKEITSLIANLSNPLLGGSTTTISGL